MRLKVLKRSWPEDACTSSSLTTNAYLSIPVPADDGSSIAECHEETQLSQFENDEILHDFSVAADSSCDCYIKTNCKCDSNGLLSTLEDSVNTAIESVVIDSETAYKNKVIALIETWKACKIFCNHLNGIHVFVHFAASDSILLIMDPRWTGISKKIVIDFILVLRSICKEFKDINYECCKETLKRLSLLISIIESPLSNTDLLDIGITHFDKVFDFFILSEKHKFALHSKLLSEENIETEALVLSFKAVESLYGNELIYLIHRNQDFEFIKDVYHGCHIQCLEIDELSNHLKEFIIRIDCKVLMEVYARRIYSLSNLPIENRPRICDDVVIACKMIADILVAESLKNPDLYDEFLDLIEIWIAIMSKLMESNFKQNMDILCLKDTISKFIECAESSRNLFLFYEILHEKYGSKLPQNLYLELYVKALCNNLNEIEFYKYSDDVELSMNSVAQLVQGYLKLADLLENVVSVSRECVLTAFSLTPSEDLMHRIQNMAIKSGKLCPEHLTDVSGNSYNNSDSKSFKDYDYNFSHDDSYFKIRSDLDNLPDPLTPIMQDNLILIIQNPRYGPLNWDLNWPEMKLLCQEFLNCSDTMNRRPILQRKDLKYIEMDIEKYNMELEAILKESGYLEIVPSEESLPEQKIRKKPLKAISVKKKSKATSKNTPKVTSRKQKTIRSQKSFGVTNDSNIKITSGKEIVNLKEWPLKQKGCGRQPKGIKSRKKSKAAFQTTHKIILSEHQNMESQKKNKVTSDSSASNPKKKFKIEEEVKKELLCKKSVNLEGSLQEKRGRGRPPKSKSSEKNSKAASQTTSKIILSKHQNIGTQNNSKLTSDSNPKKKFEVKEKVIEELPNNKIVNTKGSLQEKRGCGRSLKVTNSKKKLSVTLQNTPKFILSKQQNMGSQKNSKITSDSNALNPKKKFKVKEKVIKELPFKEIINLKDSSQGNIDNGRPSKAKVISDLNDSNPKNKFKVEEKIIKKLPSKKFVHSEESFFKHRGHGRPLKPICIKKKSKEVVSQNTLKVTVPNKNIIKSQKSCEVTSDSNAKMIFEFEKGGLKESSCKESIHSKESLQKKRGRGRPSKGISKVALHNIPESSSKQRVIEGQKSCDVTNNLNEEKKCLIEEKGLKESLDKKSVCSIESLQNQRDRKNPLKVINIEKKSIAASQNTPKVTLPKQKTIEYQKSSQVTSVSNSENKIEVLEKVLKDISGKKIILPKGIPMYYNIFLPNRKILHVTPKELSESKTKNDE